MRRFGSGLKTRRASALAGAVLMAAALAGCGGSSNNNTPDPIPTPGPQPFVQDFTPLPFTGLAPGQAIATDITITGSGTGTLTSTLNWTFASNDLDIFVTSTSCNVSTANALQNNCTVIARTPGITTKPEVQAVQVTAGVYRIWVAHFGSSNESGTLSIRLSGTR
jgi:hypothetical protein